MNKDYSHDLFSWLCIGIVMRKLMLATLATNRVKVCVCMMDVVLYSSFSFPFELLGRSATLSHIFEKLNSTQSIYCEKLSYS